MRRRGRRFRVILPLTTSELYDANVIIHIHCDSDKRLGNKSKSGQEERDLATQKMPCSWREQASI